MSNNLAKAEKRLLREKILTEKREKHRLSRLEKTYNPNKEIFIKHDIKKNEKLRLSVTSRGTRRIEAPTNLNFNESCEQTIHYFDQIKVEFIYGLSEKVFLDLSKLENISPEAALVLLAELTRGAHYAVGRKRIVGNYPKGDRASEMLVKIGFYKMFQIKTPQLSKQDRDDKRIYFKAVFGNTSDGRLARPLIDMFNYIGGLSTLISKRLYGALIECMDNVKAHAYPDSSTPRAELIGEWWMAGYVDPSSQQIAFTFFDQGVGIPTTIKQKRSVRFKSYLTFTDQRIISKAVLSGLSRRKSGRHGNGLPSLRKIIDIAPSGFLRVISNKGDFIYQKDLKTKSSRIPFNLDGSLVIWTIKGSCDDSSPSSIDLLPRVINEQKELFHG